MGWDLTAIGEKETNKTFVRQHSTQADKISFSFEKNLLNDGFCCDILMQNLFPLDGAAENLQTEISPISRTFSMISSAVFSTDSSAFSCEFDVCKTKGAVAKPMVNNDLIFITGMDYKSHLSGALLRKPFNPPAALADASLQAVT